MPCGCGQAVAVDAVIVPGKVRRLRAAVPGIKAQQAASGFDSRTPEKVRDMP
jgi:hypothetical protein